MEYHHVNPRDILYVYEFENMIKELKMGLDAIENKTERICKKISALQFLKDYDNLNEKGKALIDPFFEMINSYKKDINLYFKNIMNEDVLTDLRYESDDVKTNNKFAYFHVFVALKKNGFDELLIKTILEECLLPLYFLLQNKTLVQSLDSFFQKYLLGQPNSLELFVSENDIKNERKVKMYFPQFTDNEINKWICDYLSQETCNMNYLHCILLHKKGYKVFPKTIVAIKKRYKEIEDSLAKNAFTFPNNVNVAFNHEQTEPKIERREGNTSYFSFSGKWILDNQDYPTLLNNLIYIFDLVDNKFRISSTYNSNKDGTIYSSMRTQHETEYGSNIFNLMQITQQDIFSTYVLFLRNACKINMEDIFVWFCNKYLPQEFGINGMTLSLEPITNSALSRCRNIFIQIERLYKQYMVFIDNGEFSRELYGATRASYKFSQYKTSIHDKYYVLNEKLELSYLLFLLFNDQSGLCYIDEEIKAKNFTALLAKFKLKRNSFPDYNKSKIEKLLLEGFIKELDNGILTFPSKDFVSICLQLYFIGFLSRGHLTHGEQLVVSQLLKKGYIKGYSALLSPQEANLFSYYLNDEKYSNAKHLRNAYEHGELDNEPESVHETNYLIGLRFLALAIIKINDDLCLMEDEK